MMNGLFIFDASGVVLLQHKSQTNVSAAEIYHSFKNLTGFSSFTKPQLTLVSTQELVVVSPYENLYIAFVCNIQIPVVEVGELISTFVFICETFLNTKLTSQVLINPESKVSTLLIYSVMMDTNIPRVTEPDFVRRSVVENSLFTKFFRLENSKPNIPPHESNTSNEASNCKFWRSQNVNHANQELFVDVIEKVEGVVGTKPVIQGEIRLKSRLNGIPRVDLELNNNTRTRNFRFHRAVDCSKFTESGKRIISFVPPDESSVIARFNAELGDRELVHATLEKEAPQSCNIPGRTGEDTTIYSIVCWTHIDKIEHVSDLEIVVRFPEKIKIVKEISSTTGNFNVSVPQRCVLTFEKLVPTGWKSQLRFVGYDNNDRIVAPLYAEVKYKVQGRCLSGIKVKSINVISGQQTTMNTPLAMPTTKPSIFKGVRYQQRISHIIK